MIDKSLYIFIDEGGNLDFSEKGTNFFTLTALSKVRPFAIYESLVNLKYDLWDKGIYFEYFHATEDTQKTRDEVFRLISSNLSKFTVDSVIVEKRKTSPSLQKNQDRFYKQIFEILLDYIIERQQHKFSKIFIITDTIPIKRKRKEIEKAIKKSISSKMRFRRLAYSIFHFASKSDLNLQIVDYFNWAIFRKWERKDRRSYDLVKDVILSEFDVFNNNKKNYY